MIAYSVVKKPDPTALHDAQPLWYAEKRMQAVPTTVAAGRTWSVSGEKVPTGKKWLVFAADADYAVTGAPTGSVNRAGCCFGYSSYNGVDAAGAMPEINVALYDEQGTLLAEETTVLTKTGVVTNLSLPHAAAMDASLADVAYLVVKMPSARQWAHGTTGATGSYTPVAVRCQYPLYGWGVSCADTLTLSDDAAVLTLLDGDLDALPDGVRFEGELMPRLRFGMMGTARQDEPVEYASAADVYNAFLPREWYALLATAENGTAEIEIESVQRLTDEGGETVAAVLGDAGLGTVTIHVADEIVPEVNVPVIERREGDPTADTGRYVRDYSLLKAKTYVRPGRGSTLYSVQMTLGGQVLPVTQTAQEDGSVLVEADFVPSVSAATPLALMVAAVDGRGRVGTAAPTVEVLRYEPLPLSLQAYRADSTGAADESNGGVNLMIRTGDLAAAAQGVAAGVYSPIPQLAAQMREDGFVTWTALGGLNTGENGFDFGVYSLFVQGEELLPLLEADESYSVLVTATDTLAERSELLEISTVWTPMSVRAADGAIAFGKVADAAGCVEFDPSMRAIGAGVANVYAASVTQPTEGAYELALTGWAPPSGTGLAVFGLVRMPQSEWNAEGIVTMNGAVLADVTVGGEAMSELPTPGSWAAFVWEPDGGTLNFIEGGSGAALKVIAVGDASLLPETAAEGTVAIVSAVQPGAVQICAQAPQDGAAGDVWMRGDMPGGTAIALDARGLLTVYPTDVRQYDGAAWKGVDAYAFTDGAWQPVRPVYAFRDGDPCEGLSGGWVAASGTLNKYDGEWQIVNGVLATSLQVDLTDVATVRFWCRNAGTLNTHVGVGTTTAVGSWKKYATLATSQTVNTAVDVDVSAVEEAVYIKMQTGTTSASTGAWLERVELFMKE